MDTIYSIANGIKYTVWEYSTDDQVSWTSEINWLDLVDEFTKMASDISGATPADVAAVIPDWTPLIEQLKEWTVTIISNLEWTGYDYTMTAFDSDGLGTTIMNTLSSFMDTSGFDEAVLREYATRLVDLILYRDCAIQQDDRYNYDLYGYYLYDAQEDL
jgi:hypothetical protein